MPTLLNAGFSAYSRFFFLVGYCLSDVFNCYVKMWLRKSLSCSISTENAKINYLKKGSRNTRKQQTLGSYILGDKVAV